MTCCHELRPQSSGDDGTGLGLDAWWDEPAYRASRKTFSERGAFILAELRAHDAAKLQDVLADASPTSPTAATDGARAVLA